MAENRRCPGCKEVLPLGTGTYFDVNHNVHCSLCNCIVLAARAATERADKKVTQHNPHANWHNRQVDDLGHDPVSHYESD